MTSALPSPLGGPPPVEIPLASAPLERVIAQVQFTPIARIDERSFVAGFQDGLRAEYPFFSDETAESLQFALGAAGQSFSTKKQTVWIFLDAEKNWRISLTSEAIALEVKKYSNRSDFLARWSRVLAQTKASFDPSLVVRVGMRYVDRIRGSNVSNVSTLIEKEYLGPLLTKYENRVRHLISETSLSVEEGNLLLRLGKLPSGGTIDPRVLEPIDQESFIIDIDVSSLVQQEFELEGLDATFRKFSERAYTIFRNVVTKKFDEVYGGQS